MCALSLYNLCQGAHDAVDMEQAASRTSFQSLRPRQRTTSRLSRSRASSISSSSSSASDADLPNAKYAASTSASTTAKPVDPVVMPGLPPGVTTGGLGVSISGGQANHVYDSVNSEATPRIRLTSGLYPSSHSKHTASTKTRSVSDNVSHRPNGSMQASSHFAPSLAPTSTSFQSIPATSAISPAYNPYQYIPTTATRQPFTYKPPTRNTSGPRSQSTSVAGSSRPPNHRTLSNDSAVSDPNIIDMSSSAQRSSSLTPRTQSIRQTLPSIVLSQEEEPPVVRQIESDYVPTLDNPERHKNSNHKGGFGSVVGKIEVDMRFALFRGGFLLGFLKDRS